MAAAAAAVAAAVAAAAAAVSGYDGNGRRASSRVIRLAAGGDVWRWWAGGYAGLPVVRFTPTLHPTGGLRWAN